MEELKKSHAEHDAEVRRLSREMQRMKRRARQHGGPMKIREPQRTIARVLVCMNNGDPTAALHYVSRSSKTRCLDAWSKADLEAELREWWTATDVDARRTHLVVDEKAADAQGHRPGEALRCGQYPGGMGGHSECGEGHQPGPWHRHAAGSCCEETHRA